MNEAPPAGRGAGQPRHSDDAVIIAAGTNNEPKEFLPITAGLLLARPQLCTDHRSICQKMTHSLVLAAKFLLTRKDYSIASLQKRFPKTDVAVVRVVYEAVKRMTHDPPAITVEAFKNGDLMNAQADFLKPEDALSRTTGSSRPNFSNRNPFRIGLVEMVHPEIVGQGALDRRPIRVKVPRAASFF